MCFGTQSREGALILVAKKSLELAIVNAKNSFRITRKTRFLKKAGFPDLSGKNFYHIQKLH
jgi:hypothetical protein